ncbi:hypothetical protein M0R88_16065 [Halorussus gelatinilyticus]|uniref:HVO-A0261-like N-terminal domain-containing protein n=1 Tax=Halorussus gelatinilyticus TaxID=2937524 RepID=A0A8U0IG02_9EURY|nr:hypothetical protein [Halorussus gelatinilyticus]UPW00017.1 hypothetical protein M0R88_16065 [Halorussus gelatinilyticus]
MVPTLTDDVLLTLFKRRRYLRYLLGDPKSKSELIDGTESACSTVDRTIRELESVGAVERTAAGYGATALGRLAYRELVQTRREFDGIIDCEDALRSGNNTDEFSTALFRDATVVRPTRSEPDAPLRRLCDCVRGADALEIMSPLLLDQSVRFYHEAVTTTCPRRSSSRRPA